jgi:hypothetical protein
VNTLDLQIQEGVCRFHPCGECTLVEAVEMIAGAIAHCRDRRVSRLLVNATGLVGVPVPTLVDRFLMAEEWAHQARSAVVVALVVHAQYIHPKKFGVRVATDFGLVSDVYTSETDALQWLSRYAVR